jgi:hypothetical protein
LPWTGVSGMGTSSKVLDLFGSGLSTSEDEVAALAPCRKRRRKSPFYFLCLLYLTFVLLVGNFRLAGVSTDGGAKESGHQEVCTAKSPSSREPSADPKSATPRDTGVLDIALVSGRTRTVNSDVVC